MELGVPAITIQDENGDDINIAILHQVERDGVKYAILAELDEEGEDYLQLVVALDASTYDAYAFIAIPDGPLVTSIMEEFTALLSLVKETQAEC